MPTVKRMKRKNKTKVKSKKKKANKQNKAPTNPVTAVSKTTINPSVTTIEPDTESRLSIQQVPVQCSDFISKDEQTHFWNDGGGIVYQNRVAMLLHFNPVYMKNPTQILGLEKRSLPLCITVLLMKYHWCLAIAPVCETHREMCIIIEKTLQSLWLSPILFDQSMRYCIETAVHNYYELHPELLLEYSNTIEFVQAGQLRTIVQQNTTNTYSIVNHHTALRQLLSSPTTGGLPINAMHRFRNVLFAHRIDLINSKLVFIPQSVYDVLKLHDVDTRCDRFKCLMNPSSLVSTFAPVCRSYSLAIVITLKLLGKVRDPIVEKQLMDYLKEYEVRASPCFQIKASKSKDYIDFCDFDIYDPYKHMIYYLNVDPSDLQLSETEMRYEWNLCLNAGPKSAEKSSIATKENQITATVPARTLIQRRKPVM